MLRSSIAGRYRHSRDHHRADRETKKDTGADGQSTSAHNVNSEWTDTRLNYQHRGQ